MKETVVRRLPVENGVSGWEAIGRRTFTARRLEADVTADWLIIGAGFAGLSAARRLLQLRPLDRIVLLDASEVAKGTAGRNSGFMIDVPHNLSSSEYSSGGALATRIEMEQNRFAIDFAQTVATELGMPKATFDRTGKINAAATDKGMKLNASFGASLDSNGEKHTYLDAKEMRALTGSDYYLGGLYTPGAAIIQPAEYIRGLAGDISAKIDLFERTPVMRLRRDGKTWKATTPGGSVSAPKAILAVNGHIDDFGHFGGRMMHIFAYASMTAAFRDDASRSTGKDTWALLPADAMGATLRKITIDGMSRIVIRTKYTYETSVAAKPFRMKKMEQAHRASLDARFPGLSEVRLEYSWAGRLCLSRNHSPAFGEIDEDLYSACCENGLGTVKSTLAGIMAAELATDTRSSRLETFMDHPSPNRLPPEPFAWLGINSVIRWQEFKAGREG